MKKKKKKLIGMIGFVLFITRISNLRKNKLKEDYFAE